MFLPIGDSTIIDRIFTSLEDNDRISEVFGSTNECFAQNFRDYLAAGEFEKSTLSVEGTSVENEKRGVVGALAELEIPWWDSTSFTAWRRSIESVEGKREWPQLIFDAPSYRSAVLRSNSGG